MHTVSTTHPCPSSTRPALSSPSAGVWTPLSPKRLRLSPIRQHGSPQRLRCFPDPPPTALFIGPAGPRRARVRPRLRAPHAQGGGHPISAASAGGGLWNHVGVLGYASLASTTEVRARVLYLVDTFVSAHAR